MRYMPICVICLYVTLLVGYIVSNIYKLYNPSNKKIIRARDVIFNKTSLKGLEIEAIIVYPTPETEMYINYYNNPVLEEKQEN